MHYVMFYHYVADYLERRGPLRAEHLAAAWQAVERGELVLGGVLEDPPDRALLIFRTDSPEIIEAFAKNDPYVRNGLVVRWEVRRWNTVVGREASNPIR